jgi:hypothetical protein
VYAGIIAIGIAAFAFRYLLTLAERGLFPWKRKVDQSSTSSVAAVAAARAHAK